MITVGSTSYTFRVCFEYDGLQHDDPNHGIWKGIINDFYKQVAHDIRRQYYADKEHVITIKLKERDGYNYRNIQLFEAEIIKQFEEQTGIRLDPKNPSSGTLILGATGYIGKQP